MCPSANPAKVLVLGGSAEGYAIAARLAGIPGIAPLTSFAGITTARRPPAGASRIGGFGGASGLAVWLAREDIAAAIDATHPFASTMKANATAACIEAGVPLVHVWRPAWHPVDGDRWIEVDDMAQAALAVPAGAGRVFLTVGRTELSAFSARPDLAFIARVIDPPGETGIARLEIVRARGPFDEAEERGFLSARGIACIVSKNSGGAAARAKLDAARMLGLPVVMVRRPKPPAVDTVADVEGALAWLGRLGLQCPVASEREPAA